MHGSPSHLQVTSHIVRLGDTIYQISNICSASAYQYKGNFKDLMLIVLPSLWGWTAAKWSPAAGAPFLIFSIAYLIRLASLMSRYSLHIEMSSGSSDLFYTHNRTFLASIVGAIEHSMVNKNGPIYNYNIRDERVNVIGYIENAGHIENIGSVAYWQHQAGSPPPGNQEHLHSRQPNHP